MCRERETVEQWNERVHGYGESNMAAKNTLNRVIFRKWDRWHPFFREKLRSLIWNNNKLEMDLPSGKLLIQYLVQAWFNKNIIKFYDISCLYGVFSQLCCYFAFSWYIRPGSARSGANHRSVNQLPVDHTWLDLPRSTSWAGLLSLEGKESPQNSIKFPVFS